MKRTAVAALFLSALLATAAPAHAQVVNCPPGTKAGSSDAATGKLHFCERPGQGGPVRHGPMVGIYTNGRRWMEVFFVDGTPQGPIRTWYESGQPSASGETRPDNGTLTLWDERGRRRALIEVRSRELTTHAWDEQGREEPYKEDRLAKALAANRDLGFIMNLFAVGIGR